MKKRKPPAEAAKVEAVEAVEAAEVYIEEAPSEYAPAVVEAVAVVEVPAVKARTTASERLAELVQGTDESKPMIDRVLQAVRARLLAPKVDR